MKKITKMKKMDCSTMFYYKSCKTFVNECFSNCFFSLFSEFIKLPQMAAF